MFLTVSGTGPGSHLLVSTLCQQQQAQPRVPALFRPPLAGHEPSAQTPRPGGTHALPMQVYFVCGPIVHGPEYRLEDGTLLLSPECSQAPAALLTLKETHEDPLHTTSSSCEEIFHPIQKDTHLLHSGFLCMTFPFWKHKLTNSS